MRLYSSGKSVITYSACLIARQGDGLTRISATRWEDRSRETTTIKLRIASTNISFHVLTRQSELCVFRSPYDQVLLVLTWVKICRTMHLDTHVAARCDAVADHSKVPGTPAPADWTGYQRVWALSFSSSVVAWKIRPWLGTL